MRKFFFLELFFFCLVSLQAKMSELDSIFSVLDQTIAHSQIYVNQREEKIAEYKRMFSFSSLTLEQKYDINIKLYEAYYPFKPDSAVVYMQDNMRIAKILKNKNRLIESKLRLSTSYILKGCFIESMDLLRSISKNELNKDLLRQYYSNYLFLHAHYPLDQNEEKKKQLNIYRDSVYILTDKNSISFQEIHAIKLSKEGKCKEAIKILLDVFKNIEPDTHQQAIVAFGIGDHYRCDGDYEMQKKYHAIAAIADARNGVKENAALRSLAAVCYETNDIDRAYRYIYQSMEDAMFANVNFRIIEISHIFPIIDKAHRQMIQDQQNRLYYLLLCIGLLSFFLIITVIYISRQMRKLKKIRVELSNVNLQLSELNESLKKSNEEKTKANDEIRQVNKELFEANMLKETYISQFLTICSMYIRKLENYQNTLNKKALENRTGELMKMLKSRDMVENELKELYRLFDTIFLDLYPSFVEKINALLPEKEQFQVKSTELLNTELRIFALIRLGITDSSKIANFLHYSLATIYNYRTRVRNKAIVPSEEFESLVMKISTI